MNLLTSEVLDLLHAFHEECKKASMIEELDPEEFLIDYNKKFDSQNEFDFHESPRGLSFEQKKLEENHGVHDFQAAFEYTNSLVSQDKKFGYKAFGISEQDSKGTPLL